ncbi:hypothetical protein BJ956_002374 [Arthrobacter psychrochitiniphilus]|nr:hypothetical protein [Arthrobacter psychrochitiniphilus]
MAFACGRDFLVSDWLNDPAGWVLLREYILLLKGLWRDAIE